MTNHEEILLAKYRWGLVRHFINTRFLDRKGKRRKPWMQITGHEGSFIPGGPGTVLKRLCKEELESLRLLMKDPLRPFVPEFHGVRTIDHEDFIEMQDLLYGFDISLSIMDCKIGTRTYLEDELVKARKNHSPRPDMYDKMIAVDPSEPTPEENALKAVTKARYMQWREKLSSSSTLGFRIEGLKKCDGYSSKDFKQSRQKPDVLSVLRRFADHSPTTIEMYLHRLKQLYEALKASQFFATHEVVGSSLLFIHDNSPAVGVWMIDFAKTIPLPKGVETNHVDPWIEGNHEEGYLFGLQNLIQCFQEILIDMQRSSQPSEPSESPV